MHAIQSNPPGSQFAYFVTGNGVCRDDVTTLLSIIKGRYDAENRHRIVRCHVFTLFYQTDFSTAHVPLGF
jgi:hypothetical protein